jgi:hypothetical protein
VRYLGLLLTMSTPPDNERLLARRFKRKLRSVFACKRRNLEPDARPCSTNVPSAAILRPFLVSSAHSNNSGVHLVQEAVIVNPHSTVRGPTGFGELLSYPLCIDCPQPSSQIVDPMWAQLCLQAFRLSTRSKEILRRKC